MHEPFWGDIDEHVGEIQYASYRKYSTSRVEVNDAMMALLAGSRLAAHTLQLTAGSTATLAQLFPAVEHITRFDLRSDSARELLHNADHHVASVAIPYALAAHEDFVMEMLALVKSEGRSLATHGKRIKAWNMHSVLFATCEGVEPARWIQSFHVLREVRNCVIHDGGAVSEKLLHAIADMGAEARSGWEQVNLGRPPEDLDQGGRLALTAEHVFTAFAVAKGLGREINALLGRALDAPSWARLAVQDFAATTTRPRNSTSWRRSLLGHARHYYADAPFTEGDLEAAARGTGAWTLPTWS